jgi:hypothetical protein
MPYRPIAPWRDAIADLQTGDLIFFRGRGFLSRVIQWATGGVWSHVAMVVEPGDLGSDTKETGLLLWESTDVEGHDIDPNVEDPKGGPMLVRLEERIEHYVEHSDTVLFSVRYLHVNRSKKLRQKMVDFIQDPVVRNSKYPQISHLLWYYFRDRFLLQSRLDQEFFCSELVAATYREGGLLPSHPPPTSYCPRDFSETGFIPRLLRSELGEELYMGEVKDRF